MGAIGRSIAGAILIVVAGAPAVAAQQKAQTKQEAAGSFPSRPVRIIVGSAPGGGADVVARMVAPKLIEVWTRSVIVENRSGTALYALEATAHATADGYTMGMGTFNSYLLAVLSPNLRFDLGKDLAAVTQLTSQPYVLVVHPSVQGATLTELIAYVKSRPGKLNYASSGTNGASHLGMELLKSMTGMDMVHIPYRGAGPGIVDLIGGQVQLLFGSAPSIAPHVQSGRLKAIAVTTEKRSQFFPGLPTVAESGVPGFELNGWYGLIAPGAIRPAVVATLHQGVKQALSEPEIQARFAASGSEVVVSGSPAEFKGLIAREIARWEKFVKAYGFKSEK